MCQEHPALPSINAMSTVIPTFHGLCLTSRSIGTIMWHFSDHSLDWNTRFKPTLRVFGFFSTSSLIISLIALISRSGLNILSAHRKASPHNKPHLLNTLCVLLLSGPDLRLQTPAWGSHLTQLSFLWDIVGRGRSSLKTENVSHLCVFKNAARVC